MVAGAENFERRHSCTVGLQHRRMLA